MKTNSAVPIKVLLLEDNPDDAVLMREGLADAKEARFEVTWFDQLSAGMEYLETHAVDAILLDLYLPDSHGAETFEQVRAEAPAVPVVVLTGLDDQDLAADLMKQGAQDYLAKGHTDSNLLSRALRYAVQRKRFQDEFEEALRQADRQKDEFLAILAHELRNPLAPIKNAVTLMRRLGTLSPEFQWAADVVDHQVVHMKRLLDDLLDVSRITQGRINLHWELLELSTIIDQAVEIAQPVIDEQRHQLIVTGPSSPVYVTGDLTRLAQVLSNLLNNAAKYTPEGGHIALTVKVKTEEVILLVRDNGMGIRAEVLPHVFDGFLRGNTVPQRENGGLGLGLTLVRSLVELHGGQVEAHSAGPEQGSEFVVRLPRVREPLREQAASSTPKKHGQGRKLQRRVLVVEDQLVTAKTMARLLELEGYDVQTAADGPSALEVSKAFRPQAVFLDIGLPGMDGYEVARCLRAQRETQHIRIIALSGYGQPQDIQRSREVGCDEHLVKPIDLEALLRALESDS